MSHPLLEKHRDTLNGALNAIATRGYWTPFPEMPSPKLYGETAPDDGKRAFEAHLGKQFELGQPGQTGWHGGARRFQGALAGADGAPAAGGSATKPMRCSPARCAAPMTSTTRP